MGTEIKCGFFERDCCVECMAYAGPGNCNRLESEVAIALTLKKREAYG